MNVNAEQSMFPVCQHERYLCVSFPSCLGEKIKSISPGKRGFQTWAELSKKINRSDDILLSINNAFVICQTVY